MTSTEQRTSGLTSTELHTRQADELSKQLWAIANTLRGSMDSSKFKDYILGVIFYRYLSERTLDYMNNKVLKNDKTDYEEAFRSGDEAVIRLLKDWSISELGYIIEPRYLFKNIVNLTRDNTFTVEFFEKAINAVIGSTLGNPSEEAFANLFDDMDLSDKDLGREVSDRNQKMSRIINMINDINFNLEDAQFDVLGTAYMILIGLFASDAGKKGGEFYTPAKVSELCATLAALGLNEVKSACDPCMGSASMLLEVKNHLSTGKVGHFYGQEYNGSTYNLARMNMLMHGIDYRIFTMYNDNTLTTDNFGQKKFTIQVSNPPYSSKWGSEKRFEDDPRYSGAGKLAPKAYADLAFLEHMIYHMEEEDGRVVVLLPHGVLFRGGAEEKIRIYIIEHLNVLDAVIGLPSNLFHGTGIPVTCMVLKKNRSGQSDNVLFIDASKYFTTGKNMNALTDEDIKRIVAAYLKREDVEKFAHKASIKEIQDNRYNLNISRYVNTFEEEAEIDIQSIRDDLEKRKKEAGELDQSIEEFFAELGI